eukprot:Rhum_TRINITY_DN13579_c0_g1::Rhum_TRINITY_DN13579_c0_g1_i1::g.61543::m.61543
MRSGRPCSATQWAFALLSIVGGSHAGTCMFDTLPEYDSHMSSCAEPVADMTQCTFTDSSDPNKNCNKPRCVDGVWDRELICREFGCDPTVLLASNPAIEPRAGLETHCGEGGIQNEGWACEYQDPMMMGAWCDAPHCKNDGMTAFWSFTDINCMIGCMTLKKVPTNPMGGDQEIRYMGMTLEEGRVVPAGGSVEVIREAQPCAMTDCVMGGMMMMGYVFNPVMCPLTGTCTLASLQADVFTALSVEAKPMSPCANDVAMGGPMGSPFQDGYACALAKIGKGPDHRCETARCVDGQWLFKGRDAEDICGCDAMRVEPKVANRICESCATPADHVIPKTYELHLVDPAAPDDACSTHKCEDTGSDYRWDHEPGKCVPGGCAIEDIPDEFEILSAPKPCIEGDVVPNMGTCQVEYDAGPSPCGTIRCVSGEWESPTCRCGSHTCGMGVLKPNAPDIDCPGGTPTCDDATCCDMAVKCDSHTCMM